MKHDMAGHCRLMRPRPYDEQSSCETKRVKIRPRACILVVESAGSCFTHGSKDIRRALNLVHEARPVRSEL